MKSPLTIKVRVTGLPARGVKLRRKIIEGRLSNVQELAFTLPGLGTMALDDDFRVEIYDMSLPKGERRWVEVAVGDLKSDLLAGKHIKKRLPTS